MATQEERLRSIMFETEYDVIQERLEGEKRRAKTTSDILKSLKEQQGGNIDWSDEALVRFTPDERKLIMETYGPEKVNALIEKRKNDEMRFMKTLDPEKVRAYNEEKKKKEQTFDLNKLVKGITKEMDDLRFADERAKKKMISGILESLDSNIEKQTLNIK